MTEYEVLNFTGPHATHHLTDSVGWQTKGSYLTRAAFVETETRLSDRPATRCACGRIMRLTPNSQHTHCQLCRLKRG